VCWGRQGAEWVLTLMAELFSNSWERGWSKTRLTKVA